MNRVLTTQSQGQRGFHGHCGEVVDAMGNGKTTMDLGHWHHIQGGRVLPASDGHRHDLTAQGCPGVSGRAPARDPGACVQCTKRRR